MFFVGWLAKQVCLVGTTAYPGCVSSATSTASLRAIFFSEGTDTFYIQVWIINIHHLNINTNTYPMPQRPDVFTLQIIVNTLSYAVFPSPNYPTCVLSAQAAWDNSGSLDIQPTTTLGISYPYCVAGNVTAGLPGAVCKDYNLASPQHTATFSMALQLATPRPLNAKSCFLLSGANAFSPVRGLAL
jgi:hypothetical protein